MNPETKSSEPEYIKILRSIDESKGLRQNMIDVLEILIEVQKSNVEIFSSIANLHFEISEIVERLDKLEHIHENSFWSLAKKLWAKRFWK